MSGVLGLISGAASIFSIGRTVLEFFGILKPKVDPIVAAEDRGRAAGAVEEQNRNLKESVDELSKTSEAGDRARSDLERDPGVLRDPESPDARPYRPGPDR